MSIALSLLGDVRWRDQVVVGDRPQALLAALAARGGRPVPADELIGLVWGEDAPANGLKSLQVLVSRTRSACGGDAIVRDGAGYRLGAAPGEVDKKKLNKQGSWGNLQDKPLDEAKNLLNRDFPSNYREAVEQYFKKLATKPASK